MLSHCFACNEKFKFWGKGKLFAISRNGDREVERFWLCSGCCHRFRIHLGSSGNVELVPLTADEQRAA